MPKVTNINKDQVDDLRRIPIEWKDVATVIQVSVTRLFKWRKETNYSEPLRSINGEELDNLIRSYMADNIHRGQKMVQAYIFKNGFYCKRDLVRERMKVLDPNGVQYRKSLHLKKVVYNVPGPHFLWHLDGCHKLIRWGFVVHVCVDGFSRTVVYDKCADNNRGSNHQILMINAALRYGYPCHVRIDQGGENVKVAYLCLKIKGLNKGAFFTGPSHDNCRVERYHRDNTCCALQHYKDAFQEMEANGMDVTCVVVKFVLVYLFMDRINEDLDLQMDVWNKHGVRTEGNRSPTYLLALHHSKSYAMPVTEAELLRGLDQNDIDLFNDEIPHGVVLNSPDSIFDDIQLASFKDQVHPLTLEDDVGSFAEKMIYALNIAYTLIGGAA